MLNVPNARSLGTWKCPRRSGNPMESGHSTLEPSGALGNLCLLNESLARMLVQGTASRPARLAQDGRPWRPHQFQVTL